MRYEIPLFEKKYLKEVSQLGVPDDKQLYYGD